MTPSPFHGIFSSFGQHQAPAAGQRPFPPAHADEESLPQEDASTRGRSSRSSGSHAGQIAVDIYELDNYYIIRTPIAGVKLSDIDIEVDEKVLTIRGSRSPSDTVPDNQYYLQECFWGSFERSVTLPIEIDPKKVKATFSKDSVLKVLIPKEEKVKIIRISEG